MSAVPSPKVKITYNSKDVTRQMETYLLSVDYLDRTEAESDELEITLNDASGKWSNQWYPENGAKLTFEIGYEGRMVPLGEFEIDEVEILWDGSGRQVSIKALSAFVTQELRSKKSKAYENITLERLAKTIAAEARLTVSGKIDNIQFKRVTRNEETSLAFLRRVAMDYGYVFNVKFGKIVFTQIDKLQARGSVFSVDPTGLSSYNVIDATGRTFSIAKHKYYDPSKGRAISFDQPTGSKSKDIFEEKGHVENKQQAEIKARARVSKILNGQIRGSASMEGMPKLVAGNNFELIKIGKMSGLYNIEESRHSFSPGRGYRTDIQFFRVGSVSTDKW